MAQVVDGCWDAVPALCWFSWYLTLVVLFGVAFVSTWGVAVVQSVPLGWALFALLGAWVVDDTLCAVVDFLEGPLELLA